jgi:hypothetical protein
VQESGSLYRRQIIDNIKMKRKVEKCSNLAGDSGATEGNAKKN